MTADVILKTLGVAAVLAGGAWIVNWWAHMIPILWRGYQMPSDGWSP